MLISTAKILCNEQFTEELIRQLYKRLEETKQETLEAEFPPFSSTSEIPEPSITVLSKVSTISKNLGTSSSEEFCPKICVRPPINEILPPRYSMSGNLISSRKSGNVQIICGFFPI